jgi:hypothetical protein
LNTNGIYKRRKSAAFECKSTGPTVIKSLEKMGTKYLILASEFVDPFELDPECE